MVCATLIVSGCASSVMMNELSILSVSTGNFARYASEEWAGAETSIATPTPKARSAFNFSMLSAACPSTGFW